MQNERECWICLSTVSCMLFWGIVIISLYQGGIANEQMFASLHMCENICTVAWPRTTICSGVLCPKYFGCLTIKIQGVVLKIVRRCGRQLKPHLFILPAEVFQSHPEEGLCQTLGTVIHPNIVQLNWMKCNMIDARIAQLFKEKQTSCLCACETCGTFGLSVTTKWASCWPEVFSWHCDLLHKPV